jgi:hypothetical protein
MGKIKDLYIGYMRTQRRLYIERTYAYSPKQAFNILCNRIAEQQGVKKSVVFNWFSDPSKYKIEKEIEFQESDELD